MYPDVEQENRFTKEIKCPNCGEEMCDSWEMDDDGTDYCEYCGKEFQYTRHVEVTYSSWKMNSDEE